VDISSPATTMICMGIDDSDEKPELWVGNACGVDPDNVDPSCRHPYASLVLLDDSTLSCCLCGSQWDVDGDSTIVLLGSFRVALAENEYRYQEMAKTLENITGQRHCAYCGKWGLESKYVAIYDLHLCPEHIGDYCFCNNDDEQDAELVDWMMSTAEAGIDLRTAWILERIASEYKPDLNDYFNNVNSGSIPVTVDDGMRKILGLGKRTDIRNISNATTALLGLPNAASRHGRATVLGLLATGFSAVEDNPFIDDDSLTVELAYALPTRGINKATVVMDLYRDEIPDGVLVNGELADGLLEALAQSSAAVLGPLLRERVQVLR